MLDVYSLYNKAKDDRVILSFRGNVTEEFMGAVFLIMESKMDGDPPQQRIRKKVNNILVECLQNVFHHMDEMAPEDGDEDQRAAIFMVCMDAENKYSILTGNHILNGNVEKLRAKIDRVNAMTQDQLKAYHREALSNSELSSKGGAGLGMIDMARKSGNRLEYDFQPVNDRLSFFSLAIKIE
jgi:hypothetical protein